MVMRTLRSTIILLAALLALTLSTGCLTKRGSDFSPYLDTIALRGDVQKGYFNGSDAVARSTGEYDRVDSNADLYGAGVEFTFKLWQPRKAPKVETKVE